RQLERLSLGSWRRATSAWRCLPSVVIVGAQKAGTTQLYAAMRRHPLCDIGAVKEVNYFSARHQESVAWYRSQFPFRARNTKVVRHCLEASPSYLPSPQAL